MKGREIEEILSKGGKLIYKDNAYFKAWYLISFENEEERITKTQFNKYKEMCKHFDDSEKDKSCLRGYSYRVYYWI